MKRYLRYLIAILLLSTLQVHAGVVEDAEEELKKMGRGQEQSFTADSERIAPSYPTRGGNRSRSGGSKTSQTSRTTKSGDEGAVQGSGSNTPAASTEDAGQDGEAPGAFNELRHRLDVGTFDFRGDRRRQASGQVGMSPYCPTCLGVSGETELRCPLDQQFLRRRSCTDCQAELFPREIYCAHCGHLNRAPEEVLLLPPDASPRRQLGSLFLDLLTVGVLVFVVLWNWTPLLSLFLMPVFGLTYRVLGRSGGRQTFG